MISLLFMLTVISNVDKAIIGFASVEIIRDLNLTPKDWGLVGSVFFWFYSISAILMGSLSDRIGTKSVIAFIAVVWAGVQFFTLAVYSLPLLLLTRFILGAGEGPSYSLAMTSASKWLPKEKLGLGLTLVSIGGPLGVAASAPILMFLISTYGWKTGFFAMGMVGVIWLGLWLKLAKEKPGEVKPFIAKKKMPTPRESKEIDGIESNFSKALFSKNFIIIAFCGFATYWSYTFGLTWLPNYLAKVRHITDAQLGFAVTLPWILITISQLAFSMFSDRLYKKTSDITRSRVFILGPVLMLGAASYLLGTMVTSNVLAVGLLSLGLTFGCITLVIGPTLLINLISEKHQGKIQGWFMAIASLGGIIGPYVTGLLVENSSSQTAGFQYSFFVSAGLLFVFGTLALLAIRPYKKKKLAEATNSAVDF